MPDVRMTLGRIYDDWSLCTKCELGERRISVGGSFVLGEGKKRGIAFVGEGPGRNEENEGRPFIGKSGLLLRKVLMKMGVTEAYITNVVACRSCAPLIDQTTGLPRLARGAGGKMLPIYKDEPPLPKQIEACMPRLYEELYLVDPVVIVTLGVHASQALLGKPVTITRDRGQEVHIEIPGATHRAVLTEKKKAWFRNVGGQLVAPVEQNMVRYLTIPTLHPAYVLRKAAERSIESPFRLFVQDIRKAVQIYERYMVETHGVEPQPPENPAEMEQELQEMQQEAFDDGTEYDHE